MLGDGAAAPRPSTSASPTAGVPKDRAGKTADELAARLADGPTRSLGLSKTPPEQQLRNQPRPLLELEGAYQSLAATSPDLVEGMAAFRERRGRPLRTAR